MTDTALFKGYRLPIQAKAGFDGFRKDNVFICLIHKGP